MALTHTVIKNAPAKDKDYKLFDGKGLFLLVKKNGAKYWRQKYQHHGKEKLLSLGVYPEISLKEARQQSDDIRRSIQLGQDPSELRKAAAKPAEEQQTVETEVVEFDFSGVRVINSSFSNALFGNLVKTKGQNVLRSIKITQTTGFVRAEVRSGILYGAKHLNIKAA